MHDELRQALEPILRDIATLRAPAPIISDEAWAADDPDVATVMAWDTTGSGTGLYVRIGAPEAEQVAALTDQVQEWVIEQMQLVSLTNWPPCPDHPNTHPLRVSVRSDRATWMCPADGTAFWPVGSIPRAGDESPLP